MRQRHLLDAKALSSALLDALHEHPLCKQKVGGSSPGSGVRSLVVNTYCIQITEAKRCTMPKVIDGSLSKYDGQVGINVQEDRFMYQNMNKISCLMEQI